MKIVDLLGGQAEYYLNHTCKMIIALNQYQC